jgi:hypothetical protein
MSVFIRGNLSMSKRRFLPLLLCAMALPCAVRAQVTTATLLGTVGDQTGAALPGATVTIRDQETGRVRTLASDHQGRYQAPALEPGTYELKVELSGFQTSVRRDLRLSVGQTAVVNVALGVGGVQEQVVVTETAPLVETTRSGVSGLVDEKQIRDLPLNGRDFTQLTLLQPGIISVPTAGRSLDRGMGTQISVAGARPNQVSYVLDGTDINDQGNQSPGSAAGGLLGVDTVREFRILTNTYSAEYGRSGGGVISAVTRSGTNKLSGSVFEFLRNDALDARNFFDDSDQPIPPLSRNQFGFSLGGPVVKDRTFFFVSYEGLRQDRGFSVLDRVPSRATRSRSDISPVTRPYIEMYPLPNGPETGASGLYSTSVTEPTDEDYFVIKLDHSLSGRSTLSMRYSFDDASVTTPQDIPLFADRFRTRNHYFTLEEKHIFGSRFLNSFRGAFNRSFQETVNTDLAPVNPSLFFIPGTQFGSLEVTGLNTLGTDTGTPTFVALNTLQLLDSATWTPGRHSVKLGAGWTRWSNDQDSAFTIGGSYNFGSIEDLVRNRPGNFEGAFPGTSADRAWRQDLFAFYVQDDVTVSRRLTLNLGLRYEFITTPREKHDRVASFRNILDKTTTVGDPLFKNPSLKNFAPRAGFAWDVFGDGKTAVRGGGGMFYSPITGNFYRAYGNRTPPFFFQASLPSPPFPNVFNQPLVPTLRLDLLQFDLENPYTLQYNLAVQREVLPQTTVLVGYVGARGIHQIRNVEANQALATALPDGRLFFPSGSQRRNPTFGSIRLRQTDGNSWYNGLLVGFTRRFSSGLHLQASYTWGKSIDDGSLAVGSGDLSNGFQPRYADDRRDNRGLSDFDIRHNFVFNYSWELPFGNGRTGLAKALVKGWQISGIVMVRSGVPFTPVLGSDRARARPRSGGAGQRPDLAPGFTGDVILGGPERYFDPRAFVLPEAGFFGNVGRNTLIGPGYAGWDAALFKSFDVGRFKLQFRAEAFNVLNHPNFGLPATTVFDSRGNTPASAGEITSTVGTSRQVQLGLKVQF